MAETCTTPTAVSREAPGTLRRGYIGGGVLFAGIVACRKWLQGVPKARSRVVRYQVFDGSKH